MVRLLRIFTQDIQKDVYALGRSLGRVDHGLPHPEPVLLVDAFTNPSRDIIEPHLQQCGITLDLVGDQPIHPELIKSIGVHV